MARSKKSALSGPARTVLEKFDRKPVYETAIAVTNAGDGLSKALAVEPRIMHSDEVVYVVLECRVGDIVMLPQDDDGQWFIRKHKLVAGDAAIVDKDLVVGAIDEQRQRILEGQGIFAFEWPEDNDAALLVAEFFAAIDEALDAGTVFRDVDPVLGRQLVEGLGEAGWGVGIDNDTGGVLITHPDDDRSFVLKIADDFDGEAAATTNVSPIGRGKAAAAKKAAAATEGDD